MFRSTRTDSTGGYYTVLKLYTLEIHPLQKYHPNTLNGTWGYYGQGYLNGICMVF